MRQHFSQWYPVFTHAVLIAVSFFGIQSFNPEITCAQTAAKDPATGLIVPKGFSINTFADDNLAHDIYCMTTDSKGRIVVSGSGYIRILIDENKDGQAESFIQFADGPKTGAQGMFFDGNDLFCLGDEGLIRYRDEDGDGKADGPPQTFVKLKTGSEHSAHAITRGPDGWWYVIAGNHTGITSAYVTLPTSPVKVPHAGVLMRFNPELSKGEVFADGLRNAYDFDFDAHGAIFTYDSDGERDISLPWYRPTRVFQTLPASNHGYVEENWKEPDYALGMPPVVGSFGRGSPTGVLCYRHQQFPEKYRNALFCLDWTYGIVRAIELKEDGCVHTGNATEFVRGYGDYGFAPTDICVGPQGYMYISVGGRGTRGGVFRVRYLGEISEDGDVIVTSEKQLPVNELLNAEAVRCVRAAQPLASWSRAEWVPLAKSLGETTFIQIVRDVDSPEQDRIRALEILAELFRGPDGDLLTFLANDKSHQVRARAIWSLGRNQHEEPNISAVKLYLKDQHPLVVRFALEALYAASPRLLADCAQELVPHCASPDRFIRQITCRLLTRLDHESFRLVSQQGVDAGWQAALTIAMAYALREPGINPYALEIGLKILKKDEPVTLKRDAVLLMQLALGGVTQDVKGIGPVFQGYISGTSIKDHDLELNPYRIELANLFPSNDPQLDEELSRLLAMLKPLNPELAGKFLAKINRESHPVSDIHYLLCTAQIEVERNQEQRDLMTLALVQLDTKIKERKLVLDSHWSDRMRELYAALRQNDPLLAKSLINHQEFGRPGHIVYLVDVDESLIPTAVEKFLAEIKKDEEGYPWTNDTVFLLSESEDPQVWEMLVRQLNNYAVKPAVLLVLAMQEEEKYRSQLLQGLEVSQKNVIENCLNTLEKFPASRNPYEQVALLFAARRLKENAEEFGYRDRIMKLLERNLKQDFGFIHGKDGYQLQAESMNQWTQFIEDRYANVVAEYKGSEIDSNSFLERLSHIDFRQGNPVMGEKLFSSRSCANCHGGRNALGPDLTGVAKRFSQKDLFIAIIDPNRDVSNRYLTTMLQMNNGKSYTGMIVYEAVDGLLLRTALNQTYRLETADIQARRTSNTSLMPAGLMKDLTDKDIADLYSYLAVLGQPINKPDETSSDEKPPSPPISNNSAPVNAAQNPEQGTFPK